MNPKPRTRTQSGVFPGPFACLECAGGTLAPNGQCFACGAVAPAAMCAEIARIVKARSGKSAA